jgi:hypothetical protein
MARFAGDPSEIDAAKSHLKMLKKKYKKTRILFRIVSIAVSINWGDYLTIRVFSHKLKCQGKSQWTSLLWMRFLLKCSLQAATC